MLNNFVTFLSCRNPGIVTEEYPVPDKLVGLSKYQELSSFNFNKKLQWTQENFNIYVHNLWTESLMKPKI